MGPPDVCVLLLLFAAGGLRMLRFRAAEILIDDYRLLWSWRRGRYAGTGGAAAYPYGYPFSS